MGSMERVTAMQEILQRIDAAAIDGRAHNIRYRQHQLRQFSIALQKNADKILEAISLDSGFDEGEAVFEFAQSIKAVRTLYEQLDLQAALDEEYSVANNKDSISARAPVGVVIIRPGQHGRLFSIVSPVAAVLAAGNCVIIEIPSSLGRLDGLLRSELTNLDPDAFAIVSEPVTVSALSSDCIVVDQSVSETIAGPGLVSNPKALTIAIVDRTANVEQAANEICRARFRFNGRSPYAPDVILVNEWVRDEFVSACLKIVSVQAASAKSARKPGAALNGHTSHHSRSNMKVLFDSCGFRLVEGTQKAEVAKISNCTLTMAPVTSLVDSVNIASSMTNRSLAACYCFGDLKSAKFLGQFIGASITFVNGIPNELLIGPIRPTTALSPEDVNMRYETNMLSQPRPQVIVQARQTNQDAQILQLDTKKSSLDHQLVSELRKGSRIPLRPTGQPSGTSLGFFDQGIKTGFVAFVLPCLIFIGYTGFKGSQYAWRLVHPSI